MAPRRSFDDEHLLRGSLRPVSNATIEGRWLRGPVGY